MALLCRVANLVIANLYITEKMIWADRAGRIGTALVRDRAYLHTIQDQPMRSLSSSVPLSPCRQSFASALHAVNRRKNVLHGGLRAAHEDEGGKSLIDRIENGPVTRVPTVSDIGNSRRIVAKGYRSANPAERRRTSRRRPFPRRIASHRPRK
jgi:hypothetical protein